MLSDRRLLVPPSEDEGTDPTVQIECDLRANGYGALRTVEATVYSGTFLLEGRVPTSHLEQAAQSTALAVLRSHRVHNVLDVVRPN